MEHYDNPTFKHKPESNIEKYESINMNSSNCIDDITIYLLNDNGVVSDCCFDGVACTISTASTDIMCQLLIGKSFDEALKAINDVIQYPGTEKVVWEK